MSEPFPSPEYIKLCTQPEVAEKLQEEWEPKFGDWALMPAGELGLITCRSKSALAEEAWIVETENVIDRFFASDLIPLFALRQLIGLLEERGYGLYHVGDERFHPDFDGRDWSPDEPYQALAQGKEPGDYVKGIGPDPETAMLRAWLEVVNSE